MAVALVALDAVVEVLEPAGARDIPLAEFHRRGHQRGLPRHRAALPYPADPARRAGGPAADRLRPARPA
ncbi:FAD binding domain-containing protein [Micromonospora sp. WMMD1102]|uniref:FAD binding domain-containing protein n=1 Tax=Micromonospora sp. WMMD1102 TaxID=3016105 RepID=UPI0024159399|nr:FAD binding domain-containing protein [Micromonospora sp. WMMD1102]MDG4790626.1 FAD binding domain-containing protein [Micromonospora sp. WMMD1102]